MIGIVQVDLEKLGDDPSGFVRHSNHAVMPIHLVKQKHLKLAVQFFGRIAKADYVFRGISDVVNTFYLMFLNLFVCLGDQIGDFKIDHHPHNLMPSLAGREM